MLKRRCVGVLCALAAVVALAVPQMALAAEGAGSNLVLATGTTAAKVASVAEGAYYVKSSPATGIALASPGAGSAEGTQLSSAAASTGDAQKFYVRNEGTGLVSIQAVASGLFLGEQDGKVVQLADSTEASMRWKLTYDTDSKVVAIANASTGAVLSLNGGKAQVGASAVTLEDEGGATQRWTLKSAKLISNGYYEVKSALGTYLGIKGSSYAYGARARALAHKTNGTQTFHVYERKSSGYYYFENSKSRIVLDVKKGSKKNKAAVIQSKKTTKARELWKPVLDRSGKLMFMNKKSGKVLEVASGKKGANVRQNKLVAGSAKQLWTLVKTDKQFSLSGDAKLDKYVANVLHTKKSLSAAFNWTVKHGYRNGQRYWSNPHVLSDKRTKSLAKDFFKHKSGNCYRFAAAFSWLARGLGYKTKVISGWVQAAGGGQAPHGWVEVRKGGKTYVCDPDLAHEIPGHNWYMTTYATSPTAYHSW